jgi:hypothetical protein
VLLLRDIPSPATHQAATVRVSSKTEHRGSEGGRIPGWDKQSGFLRANQLDRSVNGGRHHCTTHRHRFEYRVRHPLKARWKHAHVRCTVDRLDAIDGAEEPAYALEPKELNLLLKMSALGTIASQQTHEAWHAVLHDRKGVEQVTMPFVLV